LVEILDMILITLLRNESYLYLIILIKISNKLIYIYIFYYQLLSKLTKKSTFIRGLVSTKSSNVYEDKSRLSIKLSKVRLD